MEFSIKNSLFKPSLRGLFFILLGVLGVSIHLLKFPFFYLSPLITQEILILLFIDLLICYRLLVTPRSPLGIGDFHLLVLAGAGFVILNNPIDVVTISVLLLYLIFLFLLDPVADNRFFPGLLALASLLGVLLSIYEFQCLKLGIPHMLEGLGWLTGYKTKVVFSGTYGQANLFATLCLLGIYCTIYLLSTEPKKYPLALIPIFVLFTGLFLTTSRGGTLAFFVTALAMIWFLVRRNELRGNLQPLAGLVVAILVGYLVAASLGMTSLEKAVEYSGVSESADISNYRRLNYWVSALRIGLDHFWTGAGVGSYKVLLGSYMPGTAETLRIGYESISPTLWAHNDFLHIFAENGIFPLLCLVGAILLLFRPISKGPAGKSIFLCLALLGFLIMMALEYPFRYHALVFSVVGIAGCLLHGEKPRFLIKPKAYFPVLLIVLILVNGVMTVHFLRAYQFKKFIDIFEAKGKLLSLEEFRQGEKMLLVDGYDDSLLAWRFRYHTYEELIAFIFESQDAAFASYLLPQIEQFIENGAFAPLQFVQAKLNYVLGNYSAAKEKSEKAFQSQPDSEIYGSFLHLCNVMAISRENQIPVADLLYEGDYEFLSERGILGRRQLDERGIAR